MLQQRTCKTFRFGLRWHGLRTWPTGLPHLIVCVRGIHCDGQSSKGFDVVDELCPLLFDVLEEQVVHQVEGRFAQLLARAARPCMSS